MFPCDKALRVKYMPMFPCDKGTADKSVPVCMYYECGEWGEGLSVLCMFYSTNCKLFCVPLAVANCFIDKAEVANFSQQGKFGLVRN
jgi:hypothetical protein